MLNVMQSMWKRSNHFDIGADGMFCLLGDSGPCIAAKNYEFLLTAPRHQEAVETAQESMEQEVKEHLQDLGILQMWAESLDRYVSNNKVYDDLDFKHSLALWRQHMFFDPTKIN